MKRKSPTWSNSFFEELPSNGIKASNVALSHFGNIFKVVACTGSCGNTVCGAACFMHNTHQTTPCHFYVNDGAECFLGNGDHTNGSIVSSTSLNTFKMNKSKEFADPNPRTTSKIFDQSKPHLKTFYKRISDL